MGCGGNLQILINCKKMAYLSLRPPTACLYASAKEVVFTLFVCLFVFRRITQKLLKRCVCLIVTKWGGAAGPRLSSAAFYCSLVVDSVFSHSSRITVDPSMMTVIE